MDETIFNLISRLLNKAMEFTDDMREDNVSKEYSDMLQEKATELLCDKIDEKKICLDNMKCISLQNFNDILDTCEKEDNYLFYRYVLCLLDSKIKINELIKKYDFNKFDDNTPRMFESLNTNSEETKIVIIPRVPTSKQTVALKSREGTVDKIIKNAHFWYDNINEHFQNIIYIPKESIGEYTIKNVIIDIFKGHQPEKIVLGLTPICNTDLGDLANIVQFKDGGYQYFEIESYKEEDFLTNRFLDSLKIAQQNQVDVLIGPEMLGSSQLCEVDEFGFNPLFSNLAGEMPFIVATPSYWSDGKNYLSVYSKSGELIGHQYKQYRYSAKAKDGTKYLEALKDIPREILLIHIPGYGRMAFLICLDFLNEQYRNLLVKELRVDFLICPSYSSMDMQFKTSAPTPREYGTRFIWLNSCSALKKHCDEPKNVGVVSVPLNSMDSLSEAMKEVCSSCDVNNCKGCLFKITIQLKSNEESLCNHIQIEQVLP